MVIVEALWTHTAGNFLDTGEVLILNGDVVPEFNVPPSVFSYIITYALIFIFCVE